MKDEREVLPHLCSFIFSLSSSKVSLSGGGVDCREGEEDGGFEGVAEVGVLYRVEALHSPRKAHIGVQHRRNTFAA